MIPLPGAKDYAPELTSEILLENATEHPLENATEIHDDFWGIDFWCAICLILIAANGKEHIKNGNYQHYW